MAGRRAGGVAVTAAPAPGLPGAPPGGGRSAPPVGAARALLFAAGPARACELDEADAPVLQRFFEAHPEYFLFAHGRGPAPDEALLELRDAPPDGVPYTRRWTLGFLDPVDRLLAMANLWSDLLAAGVWHIGLFVVATPLHGSGVAQSLYAALEAWMRAQGAHWVRLGAIRGSRRAEGFWRRLGYVQVRERADVAMGARVHVLRVLVKPLAGGAISDYLGQVARDRPGAP
jgi:GNAT superfamily N-acetyltransferase